MGNKRTFVLRVFLVNWLGVMLGFLIACEPGMVEEKDYQQSRVYCKFVLNFTWWFYINESNPSCGF